MKLLLVGGSNTLIAGGYHEALLTRLSDLAELRLDEVVNLSIGSVTCVRGLEALIRFPRLPEFDVVLLEYAVNDVVFSETGAFAMWAAAYEGMIRRVATAAPGALVASLVFGRQNKGAVRDERRRRRRLGALRRAYGAEIIDIDAWLRDRCGDDRAAFEALYEDPAHYRRPDVAAMVGIRVADELRSLIRRSARTRLASPLAALHFGEAEAIDPLDRLPPDDPRRTRFRNSRFTVNAFSLALGESVSFDLPGPLIGLSYVSSPHSCSVLVEEAGVRSVAHTAFGGLKALAKTAGAHRFLLHNIPATWTRWDWRTDLCPRRVTLTAIDGADAAAHGALVRPSLGRHAMVRDAVAPAVDLTGLSAYAANVPPGRFRRLMCDARRTLGLDDIP